MGNQVEPAPLEDNETSPLDELIEELRVQDLEGVKKSDKFRNATAKLLAGQYTVDEWQWHAVRTINRRVDIPYLSENREGQIFNGAFEAVGFVLENLIGSGATSDLEKATLDLLQGRATVDEWIDVAGESIDAVVNIPYVPSVGEDLIFDRGLSFLAKTLHGFLQTSSEK